MAEPPKADPRLGFVREAIKAVPSVKYGLGVAGIGVLVAIVGGYFKSSLRVGLVGTLFMFVLMVLMLTFARLSRMRDSVFRWPAVFLLWSFVIVSVLTVGFLFSSVFLKWPRDLGHWLSADKPATGAVVVVSLNRRTLEVIGHEPAPPHLPAPFQIRLGDSAKWVDFQRRGLIIGAAQAPQSLLARWRQATGMSVKSAPKYETLKGWPRLVAIKLRKYRHPDKYQPCRKPQPIAPSKALHLVDADQLCSASRSSASR